MSTHESWIEMSWKRGQGLRSRPHFLTIPTVWQAKVYDVFWNSPRCAVVGETPSRRAASLTDSPQPGPDRAPDLLALGDAVSRLDDLEASREINIDVEVIEPTLHIYKHIQ